MATRDESEVEITGRDYWFKVVEFLQQNWALIEQAEAGVIVYFLSDASGIFDEMTFASQHDAEDTLQRNGFRRYADEREAQKFIAAPRPPFVHRRHPNGRIYSSGKFWN